MTLIVRVLIFELLLAAILFGSAGRLDLPWFWALIGVHTLMMLRMATLLDSDLLRERIKPGPGGRDRNLRWVLTPFILAHLAIAGLDVGRFHWSGEIPVVARAAALVLYAGGLALSMWAVAANRFFSPVVRIQEERGHHVVTSGPYAWIRHPGYAGTTLSVVSGGVVLGSWWSLLPVVPGVVLIFRRLLIEDRFLKANLDGYATYADRVRARLIPGLW